MTGPRARTPVGHTGLSSSLHAIPASRRIHGRGPAPDESFRALPPARGWPLKTGRQGPRRTGMRPPRRTSTGGGHRIRKRAPYRGEFTAECGGTYTISGSGTPLHGPRTRSALPPFPARLSGRLPVRTSGRRRANSPCCDRSSGFFCSGCRHSATQSRAYREVFVPASCRLRRVLGGTPDFCSVLLPVKPMKESTPGFSRRVHGLHERSSVLRATVTSPC